MKRLQLTVACRYILLLGTIATPAALGSTGQEIGGLALGGNPVFNADSIAQTTGKDRRWHSFPGGRLCLNPATPGTFALEATPDDLALNLGGYLGTRVLRLPGVVRVELLREGGEVLKPVTRRTDWYPHQLVSRAMFEDGRELMVTDAFVDADSSLLRVLETRESPGLILRVFGEIPVAAKAGWGADTGALRISGPGYHFALRFSGLPDGVAPRFEGRVWRLELPVRAESARVAVGLGFATDGEGAQTALDRASGVLSRPPAEVFASTRSVMEGFLRRVPAPSVWGLDATLAADVSREEHRQGYYMAWAFLYQSLIGVLPENPAFPYPQMSLGKGALWAEGEPTSPATCGWESFMGLQWLGFVDPASSWRALDGILSLVDEHGQLGGESLPSRKAETAWRLHRLAPDRARLQKLYPALRRYLLWRELNPRWIWGENKAVDERDLEFVVSWLYDAGFAERIAVELGLAADTDLWRSKRAPAIQNMREWFFGDPEGLHQLYFVDRKVHATPERSSDRPIMILSALVVKELPADMSSRLLDLFEKLHRPHLANAGFNNTKYPDNQLVALGLLDRGHPGARHFIEAILRDSIRADEFTEVLLPGEDNRPAVDGVRPSLFTALNIIDFTWLLNDVRCDSGAPVQIAFPPSAEVLP